MLETCFIENKHTSAFYSLLMQSCYRGPFPARWGQGGQGKQTNLFFNFPAADLQFLFSGRYFLQPEPFTPPVVFSHSDPVTPPDFTRMRTERGKLRLVPKKLNDTSDSSFQSKGRSKLPELQGSRRGRADLGWLQSRSLPSPAHPPTAIARWTASTTCSLFYKTSK